MAKLTQDRFRSPPATDPEKLEKHQKYYQRPEVKERYQERAKTEAYKEYQREYRNRPERKRQVAEQNRLRYHFPLGMYDQLMEAQSRACAVCQRPFDLSKPRSIHSDHCHDGKHARGLLCGNCNTIEGHIKAVGLDPRDFGERLANYLANPPAKQLANGDEIGHDSYC